jgi:hypothetical protein
LEPDATAVVGFMLCPVAAVRVAAMSIMSGASALWRNSLLVRALGCRTRYEYHERCQRVEACPGVTRQRMVSPYPFVAFGRAACHPELSMSGSCVRLVFGAGVCLLAAPAAACIVCSIASAHYWFPPLFPMSWVGPVWYFALALVFLPVPKEWRPVRRPVAALVYLTVVGVVSFWSSAT